MTSSAINVVLSPIVPSVYFLQLKISIKHQQNSWQVYFEGGHVANSCILYSEQALARKIKCDKIFSDFTDKSPVDR